MQVIDLDSWSELPAAIAQIEQTHGTRTIEAEGKTYVLTNEVLYRGHSDSNWTLQTTLDRLVNGPVSVFQYLQRVDSVMNEIESTTGKSWSIPDVPAMKKEVGTDPTRINIPCYDYIVYLRQLGFPSPLLDWTRSPYLAAFFARAERNVADRCAIFAYIETTKGFKSLSSGDATIRETGHYVTTHLRHFAKKASYAVAMRWETDKQQHFFCSHDHPSVGLVVDQDVFVKITIPRVDRKRALKQLDDYNINYFTLFQSEDALIRALGIRAFELELP